MSKVMVVPVSTWNMYSILKPVMWYQQRGEQRQTTLYSVIQSFRWGAQSAAVAAAASAEGPRRPRGFP